MGKTETTFTNFDFQNVENTLAMPMRYASNSSHLLACLEKSKLMLDETSQEKIDFLSKGVFYSDGEAKKSSFIEENMSIFSELKTRISDAYIKHLNA